jgi:hypothetical protein
VLCPILILILTLTLPSPAMSSKSQGDFTVTVTASSIDLALVDPIEKKRLVTFVNHFVSGTVNFLDKFARDAERKMEEMDNRIRRMENAVTMIEYKLDSVPKLKEIGGGGEGDPGQEVPVQGDNRS